MLCIGDFNSSPANYFEQTIFNFVFNSHNFVIFIVIYSFQEGHVNHYVCMLYKFYIILVGISLIFIDRLEEEKKNSTTGAQTILSKQYLH